MNRRNLGTQTVTRDPDLLVARTQWTGGELDGYDNVYPILEIERDIPGNYDGDTTVDTEVLIPEYWGSNNRDGVVSIQTTIAGELSWIRFDAHAMIALCKYAIAQSPARAPEPEDNRG